MRQIMVEANNEIINKYNEGNFYPRYTNTVDLK